jgi:hypothetical protein
MDFVPNGHEFVTLKNASSLFLISAHGGGKFASQSSRRRQDTFRPLEGTYVTKIHLSKKV